MALAARQFTILTCGVSQSGKSTFARKVAQQTGADVLCKDVFYSELGVRKLPAPETLRAKAERQILVQAKKKVASGLSVIIDAALLEKERRQRYLSELAFFNETICLVAFSDPGLLKAASRVARKKVRYKLFGDPVNLACTFEAYRFSRSRFQVIDDDEIRRLTRWAQVIIAGPERKRAIRYFREDGNLRWDWLTGPKFEHCIIRALRV